MGKHSKDQGGKPERIDVEAKDVKGFEEALKRTAGKEPTKGSGGTHRKTGHRKSDG